MKYAVSPISSTWNDFDRAFDDLTRGFFTPRRREQEAEFSPRVEVYENEDYYGVSFDLAGFAKEDLKIEVDGDYLVVSGNRRKEERGAGSFYTEKVYGEFQRRLVLPKDAKSDDVAAEFKNGVLELKLPKLAEKKARTIEIMS